MEYNDVYDADRRPAGRVHLRGTRWEPGDYGLLAVCWIYDGHGKLLLTRRAREKTYAGTWENSGGAVQAGEDSRQAVAREVFEETGIRAEPAEFEFLDTGRDGQMFVDHYCLRRDTPLGKVRLLPGETDAARWATFSEVEDLIERDEMCDIIAEQFRLHKNALLARQVVQEK